ncbi:unnamed protein product [Closterium sp. NIES-65]|nr:unnamed protein product [Closterium sp. NIES-65]
MQQQPRPQQGWGGPVGGRQLVWYGHEEYHPVQAGSIDGTDTRPHDRAIKRALLARRLAAYKPCAAAMDAACTLFVGRMLPTTTEDCLLQPPSSSFHRTNHLFLSSHNLAAFVS